MRDTLDSGGPEPRRIDGRHVLALLLAFFGIIFAVNGYFLYRALSTHTGVVANEPYRKGLAYNQRIEWSERQASLGWRDEVTALLQGAITVVITDGDGNAVKGLSVTGSVGRPATSADDRSMALIEDASAAYTAVAGGLGQGAWLITIEARTAPGDVEPVYRARRRLWLKP